VLSCPQKCGWAHTILFAAELREFQSVLSAAAASAPSVESAVVKSKGKKALQGSQPALASTPLLESPAVKRLGKRALQTEAVKAEAAPKVQRSRRT
jgi:hypothetical protein